MVLLQRLARFDPRQRAILVGAGLVMLIAIATMFLSLTALTDAGADYDCGPAAYAFVAGPAHATDLVADCRTAAAQRFTTVAGLTTLTGIGGLLAALLLPAPAFMSVDLRGEPTELPDKRARQPRAPRRRHPYAGMER